MSIKGKAYIAGIFEHPTRHAPDKSLAQLHAEVAQGALADAGLAKDDIDGYFCAGDAPGLGPLSMVDYMGLKLRHMDSTDVGGASYTVHVGARCRSDRRRQMLRGAGDAGGTAARRGRADRHGAARAQRRRTRCRFRGALRTRHDQHVRHVRHAPHARVRHDERAARLGQGRGLASRAAQSACHAARGGDGGGGDELADHRRSAASARLLRHQRRRRRAHRRGPRRGEASEAAAR